MKFFQYFDLGMPLDKVKRVYKDLCKQFHPDASGTNTNHKQSELNSEYAAVCAFNEYRMGFDEFYAKVMEDALKQCGESGMGSMGGPVGGFIKMAEKPLSNLAGITSNVTELFRMAFPQKPVKRKAKQTKTRKANYE